jgi:predicted ATPase/DNA-binding SARP family transcriptional activator
VEFRILGPIEAFNSGVAVALGGPRHRVLLASLLVHAGDVVPADRLIDVLWGSGSPKSATEMLHVRISELRKLLRAGQPEQADVVVTQPPGYVIRVRPDELDARRFEQLAVSGRQALADGDPPTAAARLNAALALWRGPALGEIADRPYAQSEIARLEDLRVQALEDRLDADLAVGRHLDVIPELKALVEEHPLRERFWYQLMLVLYRAGRQGEALHAYQTANELLVDELGIDPSVELQQLRTAILRQDPALAPTETSLRWRHETPNNLPVQLTSFIGRDEEVTAIRELLNTVRLVTLTGVGGAGKSRLATEIAATLTNAYPSGIWIVEMVAITDPRLIAPTTASLLGVREHPERGLLDLLIAHLRPATTLVVLDNCEHLVEGVAEFARRLLDACPRLRLLCTSRERLGLTGEVLRPVSGLRVPKPETATASQIRGAGAVRLFTERAAAVQASFELSDATASAVAEICRRLDGLPLAIELAAARISTYSAAQIAARLGDRFRFLTRGSRVALPRHRTLRAVVDWSYELLDEPERRIFDRLSVFVGGFTFEAADAVCILADDVDDLPEMLARLVDKSLVTAEAIASPEYRYRMLETLRAYGMECLDARGETDQLRARHAAFFLSLAEAASPGLRSADQPVWLDRLSNEHGNLRAALDWSLTQGDTETAARIAGSLYPFWDLRGHYSEGRRWLTRVLAADGDISSRARTRALMGAATLAVIQGDVARAVAACEEAATLSRESNDGAGLAHALQYLGFIAIYADEQDMAAALLDEAIESARAAEAEWEHGWALFFSSTLALAREEFDRSAELSRQSEAVLKPVGDQEALAWILAIRGAAAWGQGNVEEASTALQNALRAFDRLSGLWGLSLAVLFAAFVMAAQGRDQACARLLAAAESLRASAGAGMLPFVQTWLENALADTASALGSETFDREWQAGHTLPRDVAVADALRQLDQHLTG